MYTNSLVSPRFHSQTPLEVFERQMHELPEPEEWDAGPSDKEAAYLTAAERRAARDRHYAWWCIHMINRMQPEPDRDSWEDLMDEHIGMVPGSEPTPNPEETPERRAALRSQTLDNLEVRAEMWLEQHDRRLAAEQEQRHIKWQKKQRLERERLERERLERERRAAHAAAAQGRLLLSGHERQHPSEVRGRPRATVVDHEQHFAPQPSAAAAEARRPRQQKEAEAAAEAAYYRGGAAAGAEMPAHLRPAATFIPQPPTGDQRADCRPPRPVPGPPIDLTQVGLVCACSKLARGNLIDARAARRGYPHAEPFPVLNLRAEF
jgi:hypothetical protein